MTKVIESSHPAMTMRIPDEAQEPVNSQGEVSDALFGIQAGEIARICQVDTATARRWKSGESRVPHGQLALITGDLGAFSESWKGWRIRGDLIVSPEGWEISRDTALSAPLMVAQISALQIELQKARFIEQLHGPTAKQQQLVALLQETAVKLSEAVAAIAEQACIGSEAAEKAAFPAIVAPKVTVRYKAG